MQRRLHKRSWEEVKWFWNLRNTLANENESVRDIRLYQAIMEIQTKPNLCRQFGKIVLLALLSDIMWGLSRNCTKVSWLSKKKSDIWSDLLRFRDTAVIDALWCACRSFFSHCWQVPGAYLGPKLPQTPPENAQKWPNMGKIWQKMAEKLRYHLFKPKIEK